MAETSFLDEQIAELREIEEERLALGVPGLKDMFKELIDRLRQNLREQRPVFQATKLPDGILENFREMKAQDLWKIGVGREVGYDSFEDYLKDIPVIPDSVIDPSFPTLVLEEPRISLRRLCELAGVMMLVPEENFVSVNFENKPTTPRWFAMHDGRTNKIFSVDLVHETLAPGRIGLTALQGVCAYIQNPRIISNHLEDGYCGMNLSGTCVMEGREEVPGWISALLDIRGNLAAIARLGRVSNYFNNAMHGTPIRKVV